MCREKLMSDAELQLYFKGQRKEEEKKRDSRENEEMFKTYAQAEAKLQAREVVRKTELRKIQEENVRVAMARKNAEQQAKVGDSLKEQQLVESGAFGNKLDEIR